MVNKKDVLFVVPELEKGAVQTWIIVWTEPDMKSVIESVDGVVEAIPYKRPGNRYAVTIDPRYDFWPLLDEIERTIKWEIRKGESEDANTDT